MAQAGRCVRVPDCAAFGKREKRLDITGMACILRSRMGRVREETINGAKWQMLQKCTLEPVQLVFGMVLARLISPEEMGILGLTAIFFAVAASLASAGFGQALVRKIDRTEADINTMFWFNAGMSLLMSFSLFLAAPWFADFFHQPVLKNITRVSAAMMFLSSLAGVHWTLYQCRRDFKTPAIIQTGVSIVGMPVCLYLAYIGWSYWAIVTQGVITGLLSLVIVWIVSPWKPRFIFSWASFKELFAFGGRMTAAGLLFTVYSHLRTFIIGKFYSPADLGLYDRGKHVASVVPTTINGMLDTVTYPILATIQNDDTRLKEVYRLYIRITSLMIIWGCLLLASLGTPFVRIMYGESWLPCVPFLQILCLDYALLQICTINLNLIKVKGRADIVLRLEIIKRVISVALMLAGAAISVEAICWATVIYGQIAIFINCWYTGKIIDLTWWRQQKDYWPYIFMAAASCLPAYLLSFLPVPHGWEIVQGDWHSYVRHYGFLVSIVAAGGLVAACIYFGCLQYRRDRALIEIAKSLAHKAFITRIPLVGRWVSCVARLEPGE